MALAVKSEVVKLIGSPDPVREQTKMDIDNTLIKADKMVYDVTKKSDWVKPDPDNNIEGDYGYSWAEEAANKLAASELLRKWYDPKDRAPMYREEFEYAITQLRRIGFGGAKDSSNPLFIIKTGSYHKTAEEIGPFISKGLGAFGEDLLD